ncbi:MAG: immunoglobulin domain-containing protein [Bacteroidetes bacterium]|nr:immunoglobulin domain-containing protein [Bacteroidota bacterium]
MEVKCKRDGASNDVGTFNSWTLTLNSTCPVSYSWSGPNSFSSTSQNPTRSNVTTSDAGTYTVSVTQGGCTKTNTVDVTVRPVFNGGIIASSSQIACYGTQPADITYTTAPSGGTTPQYRWYKQTGVISCPSGTFNGTGWTAVGTSSTSTPTLTGATIGNITATTTFALRVDNAGTPACFDNWAGNCHVVYVSGETAPISGDVLATTTSTSTCLVSDNNWHYFRNSSGQIIAAINSNGQNLGDVTVAVTIETVPHDISYLSPRHGNGGVNISYPDCEDHPELSMRRWYTITPTNQPGAGSPSTIRLFFTTEDYTNYTTEISSWITTYPATNYNSCYGTTSNVGDLAVSKNELSDIVIAGV